MKKYLILIFIFGFIFSCQRSKKYLLSILHINDMHAQFVPRDSVGGFIALNTTIQENMNQNTLLLDAGDIQTGTLLSNLEYKNALGGGIVEMMNLMDFNVSIPGNHDFDQGWQNTQRLMATANFPIISANVFLHDSLFCEAPYKIFKRNSLDIGIIGFTTEHLSALVAKKKIQGIQTEPIDKIAQSMVNQIDPITDVIVLLTHQGFYEDSLLALNLKKVDLIVGGHSHTALKSPKKVNDILIVQAGSHTRYLGKLELCIKNDRISDYQYQLIRVKTTKTNPESRLSTLVDSFQTVINKSYNKTIGQLEQPWTNALYHESNIGNTITDILRQITDADFAVINSGAIRKSLAKGPITIRDVYEILPFNNEIITFQVSGTELLRLCQTNAHAMLRKKEGILQVSGVSYQFKKTEQDSIQITECKINGKSVKPDDLYWVASVDYVVIDNAEQYFGFHINSYEKTGYYLPEAIIEFLRKYTRIRSMIENRIVEIR